MDYISLGTSDLKVSRLGFGCGPLGGHEDSRVVLPEMEEAINIALDYGINLFDTSDVYGLGLSEERLGAILGNRRKDTIIASKFGVRFNSNKKVFFDNSPEWINTALEASLSRLNTDYIDLYQIHYRDPSVPLEQVFKTLEKKRAEGKIRYYGATNIDSGLSHAGGPIAGLASFSLEYSLANRKSEEAILEIAKSCNLGFISYGSLGQGVLSGRYNTNATFPEGDRRKQPAYINFHGEKFQYNVGLTNKIKEYFSPYSRTCPQIALRWILDSLDFSSALIGVKSPVQMRDLLSAFEWKLSLEQKEFLEIVSCE